MKIETFNQTGGTQPSRQPLDPLDDGWLIIDG